MADEEKTAEAAGDRGAPQDRAEAVEAPVEAPDALADVVPADEPEDATAAEPAPDEPARAEPVVLPAYVVQAGRTLQYNGVVYGEGEAVPFGGEDLSDLMHRGVIA